MTLLFDGLLFPLGKGSVWPGILLGSLLTSLAILISYRYLSKPEANRLVKDRIKAHILALRLYKDFPTVILHSFIQSVWMTFRYLGQNMLPLLASLPILVLLFAQMDLRFGDRPFHLNEPFIIKVKYADPLEASQVKLLDDPMIQPLMNPVWIRPLKEIDWKVKAVKNGATDLRFQIRDLTVIKHLIIGDRYAALPSSRTQSTLFHLFLSSERAIPDGVFIQSISFEYPSRRIPILMVSASWLIYYLVLTFVLALILKKRFGVEF